MSFRLETRLAVCDSKCLRRTTTHIRSRLSARRRGVVKLIAWWATDSLGRREVQRDAVDAVTLACRRRPVGKHVTKVPAASAAVRFCPRHEEAAIRRRPDCALERREKAGPARAALELPIGDE